MITVVYTGTRPPDAIEGLEVVHLPMLERVKLALPPELSPELSDPKYTHRHAVFYSQNAVELVVETLGADAFAGVTIWAVGERTAQVVEQLTGQSAQSPKRQDFLGLTESLREQVRGDDFVVSFEVSGGDRRLDEMALPARVTSVAAYETVAANWDDLDGLLRRIAPRWVVFGSPRAFDAFRNNLHHRVVGDSYRVAAIGHTTSDAIIAAGDRVDFVPDDPDLRQLLTALAAGA